MVKKSLEYYMSVKYDKILKQFSDYIEVYFPELGLTVLSDSFESLDHDIKKAKYNWFYDCIANDIPIPLPPRYLNKLNAIK